MRDLVLKRLRWIVVMRHMRPMGHLGLIFTLGLPWSLAAAVVFPTAPVAAVFIGGYLSLRVWMTWLIGTWGLKQRISLKKYLLIPVWDGLAFLIWLISFARSTIMWRNREYRIQDGQLVPVASPAAE